MYIKFKIRMKPLDNKKRQKIIDAVYKIASVKGLSGISIAEISKNTKLGVGTVYTYFSSKEEVLKEAFIWAEESALSKLTLDFDEQDDYKTSIRNLFFKMVNYRVKNYEVIMFYDLYLHSEYRNIAKDELKSATLFATNENNAIYRLLLKGIKEGVFADVGIAVLSTYIYSCIYGFSLGILQKIIPIKKSAFEVYFDMLWSGIVKN